jgi:hypothetical protein
MTTKPKKTVERDTTELGDKGKRSECERGEDGTLTTERSDMGDTRRDYTKAGYTVGDNTNGKARRHLQSQGKPR